MKHQYYVMAQDSYSPNMTPIAGPLSKKEAQKIAETSDRSGADIRNWQITKVVSKTQMKRQYGWSASDAAEYIARIEDAKYQQRQYEIEMSGVEETPLELGS